MIGFYLIFLLITLAIGYAVFRRGKQVVARRKQMHKAVLVLDAGFLLLEAMVWGYMMLVTIDALWVELNPDRPKPYFLVSWALGVFGFGVLAFLRIPIDALRKRLGKSSAEER